MDACAMASRPGVVQGQGHASVPVVLAALLAASITATASGAAAPPTFGTMHTFDPTLFGGPTLQDPVLATGDMNGDGLPDLALNGGDVIGVLAGTPVTGFVNTPLSLIPGTESG